MQVHLQLIAHPARRHVVVGVDVQTVVVLIGADTGAEHGVHIEIGFHVEIQPAVDLADLLREGYLSGGQVPCRSDLAVRQPLREPGHALSVGQTFRPEGTVGGHGHIPHEIRPPAVRSVNGGKLFFVKVQRERAGHLFRVCHVRSHQPVELPGSDPLTDTAEV